MRKKIINSTFFITTVSLYIGTLSSCCTENYPICTRLSKTKPSSFLGIGKTLFDVCNERNIKITVLSSTVAQFKGSKKDMKWLKENYHFLLCDFDQASTLNDEAIFTTCIVNAKLWIKTIQGPHPEHLMLDSLRYSVVCIEQ